MVYSYNYAIYVGVCVQLRGEGVRQAAEGGRGRAQGVRRRYRQLFLQRRGKLTESIKFFMEL